MFNIDFCYFFCYYSFALFCGNSSVDRASRCQREGRGFEPRFPLHFIIWRYSQVVRHESAKLWSPVRIRVSPPKKRKHWNSMFSFFVLSRMKVNINNGCTYYNFLSLSLCSHTKFAKQILVHCYFYIIGNSFIFPII